MTKPDAPLVVNGWSLFVHPLFLDQVETLLAKVEALKTKDPKNWKQKNGAKRLAAITKLVLEDIPEDPARPEYRQGGTLGTERKHWFRAKFYQQYRLFFRYHAAQRIIVYAWVNDDDTKRAYESSDDAYRVFRKMIDTGHPPEDRVEFVAIEPGRYELIAATRSVTDLKGMFGKPGKVVTIEEMNSAIAARGAAAR